LKPIFIDVRESYEFEASHVEGAVNIPLGEITAPETLRDIPKDAKLVLYCRSGNRSALALSLLKQIGYTDLANGIDEQHIRQHYQL
jgi:rhodanese-related sulfurtransferase